MPDKLQKTRDHWEGAWDNVGDSIRELIGKGDAGICRLLMMLDQRLIPDEMFGPFEEKVAQKMGLPRDPFGRPLLRYFVVRGRYQILPRSLRISVVLADTVFCEVSPDTQYIVELGSGWGQNLFQVYCRIAGNAVKYAACELTESGRRVTDMISALDQGMDCATYASTTETRTCPSWRESRMWCFSAAIPSNRSRTCLPPCST